MTLDFKPLRILRNAFLPLAQFLFAVSNAAFAASSRQRSAAWVRGPRRSERRVRQAFLAAILVLALPAHAQVASTVSAFRPNSGSTAGGSAIIIEGTNLDTVSSVTFGGIAATINATSASSLTVTAPGLAAGGSVSVVVTNAGGATTVVNAFTYVNNDDVARDFSIAVNPSPRWSYGSEPTRGGTFTLYPSHSSGSLDLWSVCCPLIWHNPTTSSVNQATNLTPPGGFGLHPGPGGENSVVRWTAPASGTYRIAGDFIGLDYAYPTTTDVAVLQNNNAAAPLFSGNIASYNVPLPFSVDVAVAGGDTIEFTVGKGVNDYSGDATGLDATISPLLAATVPGAPIIGPAIGANSTAQIYFAPPASNGGSPITGYTVTCNPGAVTASSVFSPIDVAGLTNGTPYSCSVTATNGVGTGPASASAAVTPSATAGSLECANFSSIVSGSFSGAGFTNGEFGSFAPGDLITISASLGTATTGTFRIVGDPSGAVTLGGPAGLPGVLTYAVTGPLPSGSAGIGYFIDTADGSGTISASCAADFTVSPLTIAFGDQQVNTQSVAQPVTVTNTGTSVNLNITSVTASGPFMFTNGCAKALAPSTSCTINVSFAPIVVSNGQSGTLDVVTDAGTQSVALSGNGIPVAVPLAVLSPPTLDFGTVPVGTQSGSQQMLLSNAGTGTLNVNSIGMSAAFSIVPGSPSQCAAGSFSLAAGASCTLDVVFIPTQLGPAAGLVLVLSSNAGTASASLTGVGGSGKTLSINPGALDFGAVIFDTMSAAQTFSVTSTGPNPVIIASVKVTSGGAEFPLTHNCATLAPGNSCTGTVKFKPAQVGARTGAITMVSDAEGSPHTIALNGEGLPSPFSVLILSASGLGFGQAVYGSGGSTQEITVTNGAQLPVNISNIYTTGDFHLSHNCPPVLIAAQSCTIRIGFSPSVPGPRNGVLVIESNAQGSPLKMPLQGTGCRFISLRGLRLGQSSCGP
jgi:hypothetical protein